ncbi:hypothetical protein OsI_30612 [Oryza sativa Indica Group]|uniref:DUF3778 domain-containing protein n=1 Tax=Oryza sativa subsp. indica TaxID=39946 RepID=A2YZ45_ORYSI|nr:hypothetical protein OsI_30612 [Oryza sativa Indica Group]
MSSMVAAGVVVLEGGGGWRWWLRASLLPNRSSGGVIFLAQGFSRLVKFPDLGGGGGVDSGETGVLLCCACEAGASRWLPLRLRQLQQPARRLLRDCGLRRCAIRLAGVACVLGGCAGASTGACAVLGGAAVGVPLRRAPEVSCAHACAALADSRLLLAGTFGILVFGCLLWPDLCDSMLQVSFSLAIIVLSARQNPVDNFSIPSLLKVGWSTIWPSLLFPSSRNRGWFVIRVELGPPVQFRLTGLLLEFLRFNDEPRGDSLLSQVTLTPISSAQQSTSIWCRSRGGNRRGLTVCQAVCTSHEAHGSSRRGFKTLWLCSSHDSPQLPIGLLLFLLFGFIWKAASVVWFTLSFQGCPFCFQFLSLVVYWGLSPNSVLA